MGNILQGHFGNPFAKDLPYGMRPTFGDSPMPAPCASCGMKRISGVFVILGEKGYLVCCVNCMAGAVQKYQDTHKNETLVEYDIQVDPERMKEVIDEVVRENPDLPEEKVIGIAKSAIEKL